MALDINDEDLVRRTLDGDLSSFALLVRRYRRAAIACAMAIVEEPTDAEDVAQEAMVQAHERLATLRAADKFSGWLMAIVRRRALNSNRATRRRRQVPLESDLQAPAHTGPDERIRLRELRGALTDALKELTPIQREVLLLSDLGEWSHAQIAEATGVSVLMSRQHLSTARRRLRDVLGEKISGDL